MSSRVIFLFRLQIAVIATFPVFLPLGCASPGPPRPPSLKLPQPVTDLVARRVGGQVLLQWTTPSKTTDNLAIKGTLTARLCRAEVSEATPASNSQRPVTICTPISSVLVQPGATSTTDTLPSTLTSDPVSLLEYRVEIGNSTGHSAGSSNPAYAAAGSAPPPVAALRATAIEAGVMLEWSPPVPPTSTSVEIDRVDLTLAATRQLQAETRSGPPQLLQTTTMPTAEVRLRAKSTLNTTSNQPSTTPQPPGTPREPAGTIDQTAHFGDIYRYTAQRVRTVSLAGRSLELRSPVSEPITLTVRDTFPPAAPTGLYAVPGQTATTNQQLPADSRLSIDLSWQPNSEPDLAGYIVYRRQTSAGTPPIRLTSSPLPGPAYRDLTVLPGQTYAYFITAIDASGNESKPSAEVQETLPQP